MNKKCTTCKDTKPITEFNINRVRADGYSNVCRTCSSIRSKQYYADNRDKHLKVIRARANKLKTSNRQFLIDYLKTHPCVDCGETDIIVLQFDHLGDKKAGVFKLASDGYKLETVIAEIAKCEVVCANDHARRTAKQFNWYKL